MTPLLRLLFCPLFCPLFCLFALASPGCWFVLVLLPWPAAAQTVYESQGGTGKVYSDRPSPGARAIDLKPLNVIESSSTSTPTANPPVEVPARSGVEEPAARYRSFAVVFPEAGGSVVANNAVFEVRVSIEPALQIARGHAFSLRFDGRPVPGRYTATEMIVPPEFFGDVALSGGQSHVVEVVVVDAAGAVFQSAPPVAFHSRFINVRRHPPPLPVVPKPVPSPVPAPMPTPARKPVPPVEEASGERGASAVMRRP